VTHPPTTELDWLIDDLTDRLAGVRHVVVHSTDGLLMCRSTGMSREDGEHFAAISSALYGLACSAGTRFQGGGVQQVVIDLEQAVLFVTAAGSNACLAVQAESDIDLGMVAYEMNLTVRRVGTLLSSAPREGRL
jgi:predicted regulator of Ras-like GTPase activity (Roadblock/LC7/MglB family)